MKKLMLFVFCAMMFLQAAAQCPPEQDCGWYEDGDEDGNTCSPWNCDGEYLNNTITSPYGVVLKAEYCQDCTRTCAVYTDPETGMQMYDLAYKKNCHWVNLYASNDIETMPFDQIMSVMNDITARAMITKSSVAMADFKLPCDPEDDCDGDDTGDGTQTLLWCESIGPNQVRCCYQIGATEGNVVCHIIGVW